MTETMDEIEDGLVRRYGFWGNHPKYPMEDWQAEVASNDTRLSYWHWVSIKLDEG